MPLQANLFLEPHIDFRPADNVHPRPIDVQRSPLRTACMDRSTAAAKEIRECIEGKIHENVDLTVNVEEDIVVA